MSQEAKDRWAAIKNNMRGAFEQWKQYAPAVAAELRQKFEPGSEPFEWAEWADEYLKNTEDAFSSLSDRRIAAIERTIPFKPSWFGVQAN